MQKRQRIFWGIAAFALLFVIAGCSDGIEKYREEYNGLSGPGSLEAITDYEGVVILTWEAVNNATSYRVYRRDTVTGSVTTLSTTNVLTVTDEVSTANQLVDNRSYEYRVVSTRSSAVSGEYFKDGQSTVTAKPKVPATFTPALAAGDIEIIPVAGVLSDTIRVKIPNKPNLNYSVSYIYGENEELVSVIGANSTNAITGSWSNASRFVDFPALGGDNTVYVRVSHVSSFYPEVTEVTKAVTGDVRVTLGSVSLSATRSSNKVTLTWNNVVNAASYSIYKAPLSGSSTNPVVAATV